MAGRVDMYCIKCGADNSETAVYCRKCGTLIESEEETRVARRSAGEAGGVNFSVRSTGDPVERLDDPVKRNAGDDDEIFSIGPTLIFVNIGYVLAAVSALMLVAATSAFISQWVSVWLSVFVGLLMFTIPAYYHFQQKLVHYTLTESALRIDAGLFSRTTRNVPVTRIQDVTVSATPWQRLLGIGDLIFDNASEQGGKLVLKNINTPKKYADELLKQMRLLER